MILRSKTRVDHALDGLTLTLAGQLVRVHVGGQVVAMVRGDQVQLGTLAAGNAIRVEGVLERPIGIGATLPTHGHDTRLLSHPSQQSNRGGSPTTSAKRRVRTLPVPTFSAACRTCRSGYTAPHASHPYSLAQSGCAIVENGVPLHAFSGGGATRGRRHQGVRVGGPRGQKRHRERVRVAHGASVIRVPHAVARPLCLHCVHDHAHLHIADATQWRHPWPSSQSSHQ